MSDVDFLARLVVARRLDSFSDDDVRVLAAAVIERGHLACAAAFDAGLAEAHRDRSMAKGGRLAAAACEILPFLDGPSVTDLNRRWVVARLRKALVDCEVVP